MSRFRKDLSIPSLIAHVRFLFEKIQDPRSLKRSDIPIVDHLMSGLAVFGLKFPSLLDYDRKRSKDATAENLRNLYMIKNPPSDTYLRERLDEVDPDNIRPAFKKLFALMQRGKALEEFEYLDGYVLLSGDGTGHFSSSNVSCPYCCKKKHSNGTTTYYHQMFGVCVVHPDKKMSYHCAQNQSLMTMGAQKMTVKEMHASVFLKNFVVNIHILKRFLSKTA